MSDESWVISTVEKVFGRDSEIPLYTGNTQSTLEMKYYRSETLSPIGSSVVDLVSSLVFSL